MTDTEKILEAINTSRSESEERHRKLWEAIPQDHLDKHKVIDDFMGRLKPGTHLEHHEFTESAKHRWEIITDQVARNIGNILSIILGLGGLVYIGQMAGWIPR